LRSRITSLEFDRNEKLAVYAEAGIVEYWIVNLIDEQIEVHRNPKGGAYQEQTIYRGHREIHPLTHPSAAFRPSQLFQ
jgi:Uma2 family endonuclease